MARINDMIAGYTMYVLGELINEYEQITKEFYFGYGPSSENDCTEGFPIE